MIIKTVIKESYQRLASVTLDCLR